MDQLKDRLKKARRRAGLTQKDVETSLSGLITQATYSGLERGINKSTSRIVELANLFDVNPNWLASGAGDMIADKKDDNYKDNAHNTNLSNKDGYIMIKKYDISKGLSGEIKSLPSLDSIPFSRDWLNNAGLNSDNLAIISPLDNSMSPTINKDQVLLLDTSDSKPQTTKVYLLYINRRFYIKRLINLYDKWILRSDNQDKNNYPDIEISDNELASLNIKGRIVWQSGLL